MCVGVRGGRRGSHPCVHRVPVPVRENGYGLTLVWSYHLLAPSHSQKAESWYYACDYLSSFWLAPGRCHACLQRLSCPDPLQILHMRGVLFHQKRVAFNSWVICLSCTSLSAMKAMCERSQYPQKTFILGMVLRQQHSRPPRPSRHWKKGPPQPPLLRLLFSQLYTFAYLIPHILAVQLMTESMYLCVRVGCSCRHRRMQGSWSRSLQSHLRLCPEGSCVHDDSCTLAEPDV